MIPLLLIALPLFGAGLCFCARRSVFLPKLLLLVTATLELLAVLAMRYLPIDGIRNSRFPGWIAWDPMGGIILLATVILFFFVSIHTLKWLPPEATYGEGYDTKYIRTFCGCLLAFLGTMVIVILARNFGLLWVAVEATTLVSAPLILFHRSRRSTEAMWKYLLICSVGIGFALFGTMLLAVAAGGHNATLNMAKLAEMRNAIHPSWFKAAFIFVLAGYGTKMGLAPFHTWLPDAHSEAPGVVSALLSGALLNCSFLGIVRFKLIAPDAVAAFTSKSLVVLGLLSLATAAFFIIRQTDFKRMLAYSSVEHMGLLAIFLGTGALNIGMLHLFGHSLAKMTLFLLAGNFLLACGTRQIPVLGGLIKHMPRTSWLWLIAILMVCGMPPSPLFYTEFMLLFRVSGTLALIIVLLLFLVFAGMTHAAIKMTLGPLGKTIPTDEKATAAERLFSTPLITLTVTIAFGCFLLWQAMGGR